MSVNENTQLYELVADHMDYWAGTQWEDRFQDALDRDDLDELEHLLHKSSIAMFDAEYAPDEVNDEA